MRTPRKCVPAGPDASDDQDDGQPLQESAGHGEEVRGIDRLEQKEKNYKTKNKKSQLDLDKHWIYLSCVTLTPDPSIIRLMSSTN